MARAPSLARLSLGSCAETRVAAPARARARTTNDGAAPSTAQLPTDVPPEIWRLITALGADDDVCDNIKEMCDQLTLLTRGAASCKDDSLFDEINARLGWYGTFASLEAVRADFARSYNEVDWTVPETAKNYFKTVCAAFRMDVTGVAWIDEHFGRPYFVPLAKRAVRMDPMQLREIRPGFPGYVEIAKVAVRVNGDVLDVLPSDAMEYEEYVQLATIAVARQPWRVEEVVEQWPKVVTMNVDDLSSATVSELATNLVIACMESRTRDVAHLRHVMDALERIDYGSDHVDVRRVFKQAVALCAAEYARRAERLGARDGANADSRRLELALEESLSTMRSIANTMSGDHRRHEDAYRAAVVEAAKNFDILRVWIDEFCPVVQYVDPSRTPRYIEMLEYVAENGDVSDLQHVQSGTTYLTVEKHYAIAQKAVERLAEYGIPYFEDVAEFTREQKTDLAILAMSLSRSYPAGRWPNPNPFLGWLMTGFEWVPAAPIANLDELPYDLVKIFDAAARQIGVEAQKSLLYSKDYDARVFEWAVTTDPLLPHRRSVARRTNWLHAQYEKLLFFSNCHPLCEEAVLHRMSAEFNEAMLLLKRDDFVSISSRAAEVDDFGVRVERMNRLPSAPPDVARDGVVDYPGFEYPGYVARVRDPRNVRTTWTARLAWLSRLNAWASSSPLIERPPVPP